MREKMETRSRKDPGAAYVVDGGKPVLATWVAEECKRVLGQDMSELEARVHADLVGKAKE